MHVPLMRLGAYLRETGLSDEQFASQVGVSRTTVLRWRRDVVMPGRAAQRRIFAATLGRVSPNDLTMAPAGDLIVPSPPERVVAGGPHLARTPGHD